MNTQPVEPQVKGDGDSLDLHSMFFTIQGEGPFTGHRAIFVRLAGCNLQCPWCDTEYTAGRRTLETKEILIKVRDLAQDHGAFGCLVVITGGEPLRQPIGRFVKLLRDFNFKVQIESNGVLPPDKELANSLEYDKEVVLVVSPKTHRIHKDSARYATAYKYVLDHRSIDKADGLPKKALNHPNATHVARPALPHSKPIYVSPCDTQNAQDDWLNLQLCAKAAMDHGYICGVQLHKILDMP